MPDQSIFVTVLTVMFDLLNWILKWGQIGQKSCFAILASDVEEIMKTLSVKFTIAITFSEGSRPLSLICQQFLLEEMVITSQDLKSICYDFL